MTKYIIRRLLQAIPTFFGITILSYSIIVLAPGNPVEIMFFDPNMTQEDRAAVAEQLGINDPLPVQYLRWLVGDDWLVVDRVTWYQVQLEDGSEGWLSEHMVTLDAETNVLQLTSTRRPFYSAPDIQAETVGNVGRRTELELVDTRLVKERGDNRGILRGDFGQSFQFGRPSLELIFERFWASFELSIAVILVGLAFGWVIGVLSAVWRGSIFDQFARVLAVVGDAIPSFWLGIMAILFFGARLGWLPLGGRFDAGLRTVPPLWDRLEFLILPTAVLALGGIAGWSRYIRASMLDNINSDYIRTAKSKGLPPRTVWFKHAFRNAVIPMATFLGPTLLAFYGGAVVIETVFSWPGMGRLLLQSAVAQDFPVVMASVVVGSLLTIFGYIISDILYAVFDPRVRLR